MTKKKLSINPNKAKIAKLSNEEKAFVGAINQPENPKPPKKRKPRKTKPDSEKAKVYPISMSPLVADKIEKFIEAHPEERNRSALMVRAVETYIQIIEERKLVLNGFTIAEF